MSARTAAHLRRRRLEDGCRSVEEVVVRRRLEEEARRLSRSVVETAELTDITKPVYTSVVPENPARRLTPAEMSASISTHLGATRGPAVYSEEEVRSMMASLMRYSAALQTRVHTLETELAMSHRQGDSSGRLEPLLIPSKFGFLSTKEGVLAEESDDPAPISLRTAPAKLRPLSATRPAIHSTQESPSSSPIPNQNVSSPPHNGFSGSLPMELVGNIDSRVANLRQLFGKNDPLDQRRRMATKIQAAIRGFLVRRRQADFKAGQRMFRWKRTRPVIWLLEMLLSKESRLESGLQSLRITRRIRSLHTVFTKWAYIYRHNAPMRRMIGARAKELIEGRHRTLLYRAFTSFRAVTIGSHSLRELNRQRRKLVEHIRSKLSQQLVARGEVGVVPEDVLEKALYRHVVNEFHTRRERAMLKSHFSVLQRYWERAKSLKREAARFRLKRLVGKCFTAWSDHVYLVCLGLDRKRWPAARKYEVRYNQKRVDNFSRIRIERIVFAAWATWYRRQREVNIRFQRHVANFTRAIFIGWKEAATSTRHLRRGALALWGSYAQTITRPLFISWAEIAKAARSRYQEHLRIALAYRRWKWRQKISYILRVWRHQALFGRTDGLYTRQKLLKTLSEQRIFISSMERHLTEQTAALEDCKRVVDEEVLKRRALEDELAAAREQCHINQMGIHHYEQELRRAIALMDCMRGINPRQMENFERMQFTAFSFRQRDIDPNVHTVTEDSSPIVTPAQVNSTAVVTKPSSISASPSNASVIELSNISTEGLVPTLVHSISTPVPSLSKQPSFAAIMEEEDEDAPLSPVIHARETEGAAQDSSVSQLPPVPSSPSPVKKPINPMSDDVSASFLLSNIRDSGSMPADEVAIDPKLNQAKFSPEFIGEEVPLEDLRLLERVKWIVDRYRDALIEVQEAEEAEALARMEAEQSAMASAPADANQNLADALSSAVQAAAQKLSQSNSPTRRSQRAESITGSILRSSRNGSRGGSLVNSPRIRSRAVSFYANGDAAINEGSTTATNLLVAYSDVELEDIVISWAKLLSGFLEFLSSGDVTNLPFVDRRQWAKFLLDSVASPVSSFPEEVIDEFGRVDRSMCEGFDAPAKNTEGVFDIRAALLTVDHRMNGGLSWREALLKLRTMFPGAGNFSGFNEIEGVDPEVTDNSLFVRFLRNRNQLHVMEDNQTRRYQRSFLESQGLPIVTGGRRRNMAQSTPSPLQSSVTQETHLDTQLYTIDTLDSTPSEENPFPSIYASNLRCQLEADRAAEETAALEAAQAGPELGGAVALLRKRIAENAKSAEELLERRQEELAAAAAAAALEAQIIAVQNAVETP